VAVIVLLAAAAAIMGQSIVPTPTPPGSEATPEPASNAGGVINERASLREGPGETYPLIGALGAGLTVNVVERNPIGHWIYIVIPGAGAGGADVSGWVLTGYVTLDGVALSEVPVNTTLPDADLSAITDPDLRRLYTMPVMPHISPAMAQIYAVGQEFGINGGAVTKVGDSLSANRLYLTAITTGPVELGPYDFLRDTVDYFAPSLMQDSMAAQIGLNAFSVFDPSWSNPTLCEPNESPLACEYRVRRPAIAVIMFGPNDVRALNSERYDEQMRLIVGETLARGIIPVLSTFSSDPDEQYWPQTIRFNLILIDIAVEYEVPLVNLWLASRALPGYGLGGDRVHLSSSGGRVNFTTGYEARYGVSLQNLLMLHTLDRLRETIGMEPRPEATPEATVEAAGESPQPAPVE
jgi:hypothetical protein